MSGQSIAATMGGGENSATFVPHHQVPNAAPSGGASAWPPGGQGGFRGQAPPGHPPFMMPYPSNHQAAFMSHRPPFGLHPAAAGQPPQQLAWGAMVGGGMGLPGGYPPMVSVSLESNCADFARSAVVRWGRVFFCPCKLFPHRGFFFCFRCASKCHTLLIDYRNVSRT